jgi:HEAT repeat protein
MRKTLSLVISVFIIAGAALAQSISAEAGMRFIPGKTEADYALNLELLKNDNEDEVILYLSDSSPDVRIAVCMRLGEIGTSSSLPDLLDVARDVTEETDVKQEASYAYWNIRYKEDIKSGNNGERVLISIIGDTSGDETITPAVKAWAIDILGNMGSLTAIPYLETIRNDETITPYSPYFKEKAIEALAKINFINSFHPEEGPFVIINAGLAHVELYIRQWAVRYLLELNPSDLLERLDAIYNAALANGDSELASYVGMILADEEEKNRETSIEILSPRDGITVKTPSILIIGHIRLKGEKGAQPFSDIVELPRGEYTYTKQVTDKYANTVLKSITVYLQNEDPVLNPIGDKEALAGKPLTFSISASDLDGDSIFYFAFDLPNGATFNYDTQTFSWLSPALGTYKVKFRVRDGWGLKDEEEVVITVITNRPPIIPLIGNKTVIVGKELKFTITASDPDNDQLTYTVTNLPPGATFKNQTFTWTPSIDQEGTYTVIFKVADNKGGSASETITITVTKAAKLPVIGSIYPKAGRGLAWIWGSNLGNTKGRVRFTGSGGTKDATILLWTDYFILFNTPNLPAGGYNVTVINKAGESNAKQFILLQVVPRRPTPIPAFY